jgi:N-acetylglucosaminyl-diphospho-decaprenol L-rhamnosyltransferase
MPDPQVDLAVVVVTYNSETVVEGLLDSLPGALGNLRAEVIVVDNDSTDRTRDIVSARADCRLVTAPNLGYAAGVNRGCQQVREAPAFLILNPDVRMGPESVPPLLSALRIPGTGITAPRVLDPDGTVSYSLRREPSILRTMGLNWTNSALFAERIGPRDRYETPHVVDWALGAVLVISRECLEAVGPWDESFFLYSEETDFCLRARDLGHHTRYVPESTVIHIGAQSGESDVTRSLQVLNRIRLYRRRHSAFATGMYFLVNLARELSWVLRRRRRSWFVTRTLLVPRLRPESCHCRDHLLPR